MSHSLSLYVNRLSKLVDGYIKNIIDAPDDISYCVFNFVFCSDDNKLMVQKVNDGNNRFDGVECEIFMETFVAKVIDCSRIKEYKIRYKQENMKSEDSAKSISTKRIFNGGIAFIDLKLKISMCIHENKWLIQALGIATDDNILMESEWVDFQTNRRLPYMLYATDKTTDEYFNEYLDVNNRGTIEIDDWISALRKMEEMKEFTELELKRIFYYIVKYHANTQSRYSYGTEIEQDNEKDTVSYTEKIDKRNFHNFIVCDRFNILKNYSEVYRTFITLVRSKVSGLLRRPHYVDSD